METPGDAVAAATQAQKENTDAEIINDPTTKLKNLLMERAARAGVSVYEMGSGGYAVGWWSRSREVPDLRSLSRCLTQLGVAA
jgi:hypothetical protein